MTSLALGFFSAAALLLPAVCLAGTFRLESEARLGIKTGARPDRVRLNGRPTDRFAFQTETGVLSLSLPAGESRIEVTHEH